MRRYDEELLRTLHEYIIDYQKLKTDGQSNGNDGEGDERSSYSYGKGD